MKNKITYSVYKRMQRFAALTVTLVLKGHVARAKKCLDAVERLYVNGSAQTQNAISNVYVYDLSMALEVHHVDVQQLFPAGLRTEYIKQRNAY